MSETVPKILLVDDEPDIPDTIARIFDHVLPPALRREIVVVNSAVSALEAVDRAVSDGAPLLVVSDFNMGGYLDGLQLLEEIHRVKPEARLVLLSGYPPEDFEGRPEFSQVHTFLRKPFEIEELRLLAVNFLQHAHALAPRR